MPPFLRSWLRNPIHHRPWAPLALCLGFLIVVAAAILLLQVVTQKTVFWPGKMYLGHDFKSYYFAADALQRYGSPYEDTWYPTFPPTAYLFLPLARLPFHTAAVVVFWLTCLLVPASFMLVHGLFASSNRVEKWAVNAAAVVTLIFSYSFLQLADRGNIDSFVAIFVAGALWSAFRLKQDVLAGFLLTLAAAMKFFPAVLFAPFLIYRRYRVLAFAAVSLVVLMVLTGPSQWLRVFSGTQLTERFGYLMPYENISVGFTFVSVGKFLSKFLMVLPTSFWLFLSYAFFALCLAGSLYFDWKRRGHLDDTQMALSLVLYFPFFPALPRQVYPYQGIYLILMLPAVGYLWARNLSDDERKALLIATCGVALSQLQAVAMGKLLDSWPKEIIHFLPSLGVTLCLYACMSYKQASLRSLTAGQRL